MQGATEKKRKREDNKRTELKGTEFKETEHDAPLKSVNIVVNRKTGRIYWHRI